MASYTDINITALQEDAFEELRKRMEGEMDVFNGFDQTYVFYRFLKARNWDINKVEIMLKKSVLFRRKNHLETLMKNYQPPEIMRKFVANFHIGSDKEGCPIFYVPLGKCDPKGLIKATKPSELEKTVVQLFVEHEYGLEQKIKEKNWWLPGIVIIIDCTGMTLANATYSKGVEILLRLVRILQDNAPERLKAVYVINTPSFFTFAFNMIKHCFASETLKKIHVYREEGWKEELLRAIDADQLPAFMGGTRTDPDGNPLCITFLNQMGTVDESYYLVKNGNPLANSPGVKTLHLLRASSARIPLQIREWGSVIEWEFETKSGDVGYGLFYKGTGDAEEQVMEVVSLERVDTKDFVESGMYTCEKHGEYFMLFDNSYSWFRSKELFYRIHILTPHELQDHIKEQLII